MIAYRQDPCGIVSASHSPARDSEFALTVSVIESKVFEQVFGSSALEEIMAKSNKTSPFICVFMLGLIGLAGGTAWAQTETGSISGLVTDSSEAVVPGVTVVIIHVRTNQNRTVITNDVGVYAMQFLPVGSYRLEAELTGFKKGVVTDLVLRVGQQLRADIRLETGEISQTTTVVAEIEQLVKRESSELGQEIVPEAITNLPLNQRDLTRLVQLSVGVSTTSEGEIGGPAKFHSNGQRSANNNLLVDGANLTNVHANGAMFTPPVEAVQEFRIDNSNYSAEYGRAAGAIVNLVLKRGSNDFHGSLFWFARNSALDARSPFDLDPQNIRDVDGDGAFTPGVDKFKAPPFNFNQFGGTIGGPLVKDKTFFFLDYQATLSRAGRTHITSVPTALMRQGDFTGLGRIYDPFNGVPLNPVFDNRPPFPGNQIPQGRMDPAATKFLDFLPLPNLQQGAASVRGVNNLARQGRISLDDHKFDVRVDHNLSENDSLFGRWSFQDVLSSQPGIYGKGGGPPLLAADTEIRNSQVAFGETHIFSPTLFNEFRFAFSSQDAGIRSPSGDEPVGENLGIANANLNSGGTPLLLLQGYADNAFQNFWGDGVALPTLIDNRIIQLGDTVALNKGRHGIKIGFQAMRRELTALQILAPRGLFIFSAFSTTNIISPGGPFANGHPVASFLLGVPLVIQRQFLEFPATQSGWEFGAFIQDDFKMTSRLTLNLGLRWDYVQPFVEKNDRQADFDPANVRMLIAGQDTSRGIVNVGKLNFQPRVGFAYALTEDGKTVLRAGYAISSFNEYNSTLSVSGRTYQNPPFFSENTVANGAFGGRPPFTLSGGPPLPMPGDPDNPAGSVFDFPDEVDNAYVQFWNLNLQRALPGDILFDVAYAGAKGTHLLGERNINQPLPNPAVPGSDFGGPKRISQSLDLVRHYAGWANSHYHSLQVKGQKRFSEGLWFLASYTWGHSIDEQSNGVIVNNATNTRPQDSFNVGQNRANSTFDMRNRFVFSYVYELPGMNVPTAIDAILGGWALTGILTLQDGTRLTPRLSTNNPTGIQLRPDRVGDGNLPESQSTVERWFDLDAFGLPPRMPMEVSSGSETPVAI